jgi:hypothetical protein
MRSFTTLVPQLVKREQELHDISSLIIAFAQSFRIAAESITTELIFGISLASAFRSWWKPLAGAVLVVTSMNQDTISLIWLCKSSYLRFIHGVCLLTGTVGTL